jgi:hypothetical protein
MANFFCQEMILHLIKTEKYMLKVDYLKTTIVLLRLNLSYEYHN